MSAELTTILTMVVLGGLLDSVDPCLFALYASLLAASVSVSVRRAARVALAFVGAVYFGYLSFGAVLRLAFSLASPPRWALSLLLLAYAAVTLAAALRSGGETSGSEVCREENITCAVQRRLRLDSIATSPAMAALVGLVASFTLLPCSAGLYIAFNAVTRSLGFAAWLPLAALYTLLFVLPLIAISVAVIGVARTPSLYARLLAHSRTLKIVGSAALVAVALWMVLS